MRSVNRLLLRWEQLRDMILIDHDLSSITDDMEVQYGKSNVWRTTKCLYSLSLFLDIFTRLSFDVKMALTLFHQVEILPTRAEADAPYLTILSDSYLDALLQYLGTIPNCIQTMFGPTYFLPGLCEFLRVYNFSEGFLYQNDPYTKRCDHIGIFSGPQTTTVYSCIKCIVSVTQPVQFWKRKPNRIDLSNVTGYFNK